jgi:L-ribulose-5-phosphate 3-epimerase
MIQFFIAMKIAGHDIGVCSWSLAPKDAAELIAGVKKLGLQHIQLALGPLASMDEKRRHEELALIKGSGLTVTAGMIGFPGEDYSTIAMIRKTGGFVSETEFPTRKELARSAIQIAADLGVKKLSSHIGFVPPSSDPNYAAMLGRICEVASMLNERGMQLLMETGQETAPELLQFLNDLRCKNVRVNFDPANMILYGAGDPIEAIGILGRHIEQVHVKDATMSNSPGSVWGAEVPFGSGEVPPKEFIRALKDAGFTGPLIIEREAGASRMADIAFAIETLKKAAV